MTNSARNSEPRHETIADIPGFAKQLVNEVKAATSVAVVTHARVDADALGSAVAMGALAQALGKPPAVVTSGDGAVPANLEFVDQAGILSSDGHDGAGQADLAIFVDCADADRANPLFKDVLQDRDPKPRIINIDHHVTNSRFGDLNLVVPEAAATCEILVEAFVSLDVPIDNRTATAMLAGIYGDTLGLKTPSTRPATMRASAELVEAGAYLDLVVDQLFRLKPYSTVLLWGEAQMKARWRGRLIWSCVDNEMLARAGAASTETDGLVNFLAGTIGAFAAALAQETSDGWRVSLRSTTEAVNVAQLAQRFGGGGHPRAAGVRLEPGIEALEKFLDDIAAQLDLLPEDAGSRPDHAPTPAG